MADPFVEALKPDPTAMQMMNRNTSLLMSLALSRQREAQALRNKRLSTIMELYSTLPTESQKADFEMVYGKGNVLTKEEFLSHPQARQALTSAYGGFVPVFPVKPPSPHYRAAYDVVENRPAFVTDKELGAYRKRYEPVGIPDVRAGQIAQATQEGKMEMEKLGKAIAQSLRKNDIDSFVKNARIYLLRKVELDPTLTEEERSVRLEALRKMSDEELIQAFTGEEQAGFNTGTAIPTRGVTPVPTGSGTPWDEISGWESAP